MPIKPALLFALSAGATAGATGYSIYQNNKAAAAAERQGALQSLMGLHAARQQTQAAEGQLAIHQASTARAQEAANAEAAALRQQADVLALNEVESQRRQRRADAAFRSSQEASMSNSGLLTVGTPLQLMVETAGIQQLAIADNARTAEVARRQVLDDAARAEASGVAAGMAGLDQQMQGIAALADASRGKYEAKMARFAGQQRAGEYRAQAVGSALSGIGSLASLGYNYAANRGPTAAKRSY